MLDICYWVSKTGPHDVRWEKVERIRRIVTDGTYCVPPNQLAAKLLERMSERDRANRRWMRNSSGTTNDSSRVS